MVAVSMAYGLRAKVEGACSKDTVFKVMGKGVILVHELLQVVGVVGVEPRCPGGKYGWQERWASRCKGVLCLPT
jgi:hypothetical protein